MAYWEVGKARVAGCGVGSGTLAAVWMRLQALRSAIKPKLGVRESAALASPIMAKISARNVASAHSVHPFLPPVSLASLLLNAYNSCHGLLAFRRQLGSTSLRGSITSPEEV